MTCLANRYRGLGLSEALRVGFGGGASPVARRLTGDEPQAAAVRCMGGWADANECRSAARRRQFAVRLSLERDGLIQGDPGRGTVE